VVGQPGVNVSVEYVSVLNHIKESTVVRRTVRLQRGNVSLVMAKSALDVALAAVISVIAKLVTLDDIVRRF